MANAPKQLSIAWINNRLNILKLNNIFTNLTDYWSWSGPDCVPSILLKRIQNVFSESIAPGTFGSTHLIAIFIILLGGSFIGVLFAGVERLSHEASKCLREYRERKKNQNLKDSTKKRVGGEFELTTKVEINYREEEEEEQPAETPFPDLEIKTDNDTFADRASIVRRRQKLGIYLPDANRGQSSTDVERDQFQGRNFEDFLYSGQQPEGEMHFAFEGEPQGSGSGSVESMSSSQVSTTGPAPPRARAERRGSASDTGTGIESASGTSIGHQSESTSINATADGNEQSQRVDRDRPLLRSEPNSTAREGLVARNEALISERGKFNPSFIENA